MYGKSCQEMVAKNGRFPAQTGGLESLCSFCKYTYVADLLLPWQGNVSDSTISSSQLQLPTLHVSEINKINKHALSARIV